MQSTSITSAEAVPTYPIQAAHWLSRQSGTTAQISVERPLEKAHNNRFRSWALWRSLWIALSSGDRVRATQQRTLLETLVATVSALARWAPTLARTRFR